MLKVCKIFIFLTIFLLVSCSKEKLQENKNEIPVSSALSSSDASFLKAYEKRKFVFPEDNGAHYGYRSEWWYFTGNLQANDGKQFGYQLTIFRTAIDADTPTASGWNSNQIYMGHLTVTDISNEKFYYFERFSRNGNDLAGVNVNPLRVWIENWNISELSSSAFEFPNVKITAAHENIALDLSLEPLKKAVLQGENGLSRKGEDSGNASYYYSVSRLKTEGTIKIDGNNFSVMGISWLDREWSTSALSSNQQGWDWFSLHLDNNYDIMYYQMRKKDGSPDIFTNGSIIDSEGNKKTISISDVQLQVTDKWENSNGKIYPSGWTFKILSENTELKIIPALKDQELLLTVRYWEGSVIIDGIFKGASVKGKGYVELTGYSE